MRRGGTARSIRIITVWLVLITLLLALSTLREKKRNYNKLWEKVGRLEVIHGL